MSSPMSADAGSVEPISVQPAALEALAAELSVLAAELARDADLCRSAAHGVTTALGGDEGSTAGNGATAWASLEEMLADGARSLARTLTAAVAAYADEDFSLSARIRLGRGYGAPGSR